MSPIDFDLWSQKSDAVRIYLVETSARRIADGYLLPLYFATRTVILEDRCYLGTQMDLPRLSRQANSILSPNHVTTWGELVLTIEPDYLPDAYRSVSWLELLSPAWNLRDQDLIILEGGEGFAYSDFRSVFTGKVGTYNWNDSGLTLTIYDKTKRLEITMPNYELPESRQVVEESYDQTVPAVLGLVKNFKPILISTTNPGAYPWKYALACHVMQALDQVYGDNSPTPYAWIQKDVFPARKDAEGSAAMDSFGPYTGSLLKADWLVEIDSITALNSKGSSGPEVGLATFRWKLEGDAAWRGEGILTWVLAYDSATLAKSPAAGAAVMAVSGDYTGDCKLNYKVKVVRGGDIGDAVPPRVIWSEDGVTWQPNEPSRWTPIAAAPGRISVVAHNPYDVVQVEITTGGNVGGAVRFRWSNDGGITWNTNNQIPDTSPIELFAGYSVQFTAPGEAGVDDYDAGDAGGTALAVDVLSVDPPTTPPTSLSVLLNRGLSAAFSGIGRTTSWYWVGVGPGQGSVVEGDPDDVSMTITAAGACGVATFDWAIGELSGSGTTSTSPQEISPGYSVQFTAPGEPGVNDYEVGDGSNPGSYYTPAFVVNDVWTFSFKEIPIPLPDGVSIQFITGAGDDFVLGDQWRFILGSSLLLPGVGEGVNITVDARGLISPVLGAYTEQIGELIRAVLVLWAKWDAVTDFDLPALAAFNAAFPYQAGLLVDSPTAIGATIDRLLTGLPSLYTVKNDGRFFLAEIAPLIGAPILELTDVEFIQAPEGSDGDEDLYSRVYLNYDRNPNAEKTPQGAPSQERVEWLRREFRQISVRDDAVLSTYPWATDLKPLDTCLVQRAHALALANKVLNLLKVKHPRDQVVCKNQAFHLNLGDDIGVRRSRFGITEGHVCEIHGTELNFTTSEAILSLWR